MKDNLDIEKLFKDKFDSFEPDVNSQVWQNIAGSMSGGATSGAGISAWLKGVLLGTAATIVGVGTWFYLNDNQEIEISTKSSENLVVSKTDLVAGEEKDNLVAPTTQKQNKDIPVSKKDESTQGNSVQSVAENESEKTGESAIDEPIVLNSSVSISVESTQIEPDIVLPESKEGDEINTGETDLGLSEQVNETGNKSATEENPSSIVGEVNENQIQSIVDNSEESTSFIDVIPNVITPNNDRINDEFFIKSENIDEFYIVIYTPLNVKLFESNSSSFKWDGYGMDGNKAKKGNYYYLIKAVGKDGKAYSIPGQLSVQ